MIVAIVFFSGLFTGVLGFWTFLLWYAHNSRECRDNARAFLAEHYDDE